MWEGFCSNLANYKWVASKLVKVLETRPDLTPKEAKVHMVDEYNMKLHDKMVARGLKAAREQVIGKEGEQYEGLPLFDRLYISLEACMLGFKVGCRRLIGLDGCFLKGYYGGQLLSAIAQDGNNHFFIISYAVVDSENTETWKWFLTRLKEDLGDVCNEELNFISDQQKGLAAALNNVMPNANHRNCVLHLWKNFTKKFKDKESKSMVWRCTKSTTKMQFNNNMEKLKQINCHA
ncbi:uncharacterized protein LOC107620513 [Arachis ipaensis]|uniref:uncharacterized protein LOC107620513 n=1 Tax=Arachis ipaensis TaxID=130454 RepID=UPI0007AFA690|nr:uncharacterized protein LOC107620513 [Arachis ipaensis]